MGCGAETEAETIFNSLLVGEDVTLPNIDLNGDNFLIPEEVLESLKNAVVSINNDDLTTTQINGTGTFDILMRAFKAHLKDEFSAGRITGAEYTKAYTTVTAQAMAGAINFLTTKDQSYWSSVTAQMQALTARTQFETAKMQLVNARFNALTAKADYALTKLKLSTESIAYCTAKYQLDNMLPKQLELLESQVVQQGVETEISQYNLSDMLPTQKALVQEQTETAHAQTSNTRLDGTTPISGSVGKQNELYDQQITSYQRDAEVKAAKFWTDAWITMKTIDEGLDAPDAFINSNLDQVMQVLATNNGFGTMASI